MREEWRRLSSETRRAAMDLVFTRSRPSDSDIVARLQELGLSQDLATWIVEEGIAALIQAQRQIFEKRMEMAIERSPIDYFNRTLAATVFLLVTMTWLAQDVSSLKTGEFPISLPFATILSFIAWTSFISCTRRWIRSLRK
jgi:hypothetical protein